MRKNAKKVNEEECDDLMKFISYEVVLKSERAWLKRLQDEGTVKTKKCDKNNLPSSLSIKTCCNIKKVLQT